MKVAIIAAMEQEVEILKNQITDLQTQTHVGYKFYLGKIANCDVVLMQSGVGKVASATGTALLFNLFDVDCVINTGSAAGFSSALNTGDVVISTEVFYHDADLTAFGYVPGQMSACPATFKADEHYRQLARQCIERNNVNAVEGAIGSGDSFINSEQAIQKIKETFPHIIAVEMEAAAIGHVCWLYKKPFVVVRAISDNGDSASAMSFDEFLPLAAKQSSLIVASMLKQLADTTVK